LRYNVEISPSNYCRNISMYMYMYRYISTIIRWSDLHIITQFTQFI